MANMSVDLCMVNQFLFLFQGFILEGNKEMDTLVTIMIALYLCVFHCGNLIHNDMGVSVPVSRAIALVALAFVALRVIDLNYC